MTDLTQEQMDFLRHLVEREGRACGEARLEAQGQRRLDIVRAYEARERLCRWFLDQALTPNEHLRMPPEESPDA